MPDLGIKASKPGEDVTGTADKNLIYSSAFNSLKVYSSGNVTASGTPTDVAHSLGYIPAFLAYSHDVSADSGYISSVGIGAAGILATMDSSKLRFTGTANTDKVSYFIFYDPGESGATEYEGAKTSDIGMKISQEGEDVFGVSDTKTLFSSSFNTMQIREVFSTTGTTDGNTTTASHNYGYAPAFLAQLKRTAGATTYYQPMPFWDQLNGVVLYCESQTNDFVVYSIGADLSAWTVNIFALTESLE